MVDHNEETGYALMRWTVANTQLRQRIDELAQRGVAEAAGHTSPAAVWRAPLDDESWPASATMPPIAVSDALVREENDIRVLRRTVVGLKRRLTAVYNEPLAVSPALARARQLRKREKKRAASLRRGRGRRQRSGTTTRSPPKRERQPKLSENGAFDLDAEIPKMVKLLARFDVEVGKTQNRIMEGEEGNARMVEEEETIEGRIDALRARISAEAVAATAKQRDAALRAVDKDGFTLAQLNEDIQAAHALRSALNRRMRMYRPAAAEPQTETETRDGEETAAHAATSPPRGGGSKSCIWIIPSQVAEC